MKVHQRPIGQVVKTAASHAVNIGSNPVWVTKLVSNVLFSSFLSFRYFLFSGSREKGIKKRKKCLTIAFVNDIIPMLSQAARLLI